MRISIHIVSALLAMLLIGCGGNVKTIEVFQKSTDSLTNDYITLADKIDEMCIETALATQMLNPDYQGPQTAHAKSVTEQTCGGAKESKKQLRNAAVVLDNYVKALAEVAGLDVKVFDDDLKNLAGAIKGLQSQTDKPVFDATEVTAAEALSKFVAQEMTSYLAKKEVSAAIKKNEDSFARLVAGMATHIGAVFPSQADIHKISNSNLAKTLYATGNANGLLLGERLPARVAADVFSKRTESYEEANKAAIKFKTAANQLNVANGELADKYETLSKDEQLDSLKALVERAKEVRDAVRAIK